MGILNNKPVLEDSERQDIHIEDIKDDGMYELMDGSSVLNNKPVESPFVFKKGLKVKGNEDSEANISKFMKMDEKGSLTIIDRLILKELVRLHIATSRNLKIVLGRDNLKPQLKWLIRKGLVKKYYFTYPTEQGEIKTVDFYSPSEVVKKVKNIGLTPFSKLNLFDAELDTPLDSLRQLELNMFDTSFVNDYSEVIENRYENYVFKDKDREFNYRVPYMYRMRKNTVGQKFIIIPMCTRRNPKWRAEQFNTMLNITDLVNRDFKGYAPLFIVNVEDNAQACESEAGKSGYQQLRAVPILYVSDWVVNNSSILDNLIIVKDYVKDKYELVSLAF